MTTPALLIPVAKIPAPKSVLPDAVQIVPCAWPFSYDVPVITPDALMPLANVSEPNDGERSWSPVLPATKACWSPDAVCAHPATAPELLILNPTAEDPPSEPKSVTE